MTTTTDRPVVDGILERLASAGRVEHVFGTPVERDGVTVLPVATVSGGGGGGHGVGEREEGDGDTATVPHGEGGGFGLTVRPVGAFVVRNGRVVWQPALDWTRMALAGNSVLVVWLVTRWLDRRARARACAGD